MRRQSRMCRPSLPRAIILLALIFLPLPAHAHEVEATITEPGFRPPSEQADAFVTELDTATIVVLPTIVRRVERSAVSFESQDQIITYLNEHDIGTAGRNSLRIDLGPVRRQSQWDLFQYAARSISETLASSNIAADYTFVMEILVPGSNAVFGIEIYIVDAEGQHAFSFLLNEHHAILAEADLYAGDSSEEARDRMIRRATAVGLNALHAQLDLANHVRTAPGIPLIETRLDGTSSRIVVDTTQANGFVSEMAMSLMCDCARLSMERGFRYFRIDERTMLANAKASFRLRFYSDPPAGYPVAPDALQASPEDAVDPMTATIDAQAILKTCDLLR